MLLSRAISNRWVITRPGIRTIASRRKRIFVPSPAQTAILHATETHNVVVSARPGSGKTAIAQGLAMESPEKAIGIWTFSKNLQLENSRRLRPYALAKSFTFHGLATTMYEEPIWNEHLLYALRKANPEPKAVPYFDILVLDEVQDMTDNLYWLVCKYLTCAIQRYGKPPRIIVLGDAKQAIYEFRGADHRFCELGAELFSRYSPDPWQLLTLDQSFRLSHQTSRFINAMLGQDYIKGSHDGPLPKYLVVNPFNVQPILNQIVPLIKHYGPQQSAIIAPSVNPNLFLSRLTNALSHKYNIPVADPVWEEGPLNPKTLNGKLAVGTYHQMKGSERDLVVVLGVDGSYFTYAGRRLSTNECPNAIYVALSRARRQLVVIQDHKEHAVPFISQEKLENPATCDFINLTKTAPLPPMQLEHVEPAQIYCPRKLTVTRIVRHVDDKVVSDLVDKYLKIEPVSSPLPKSEQVDAVDIVKTDSKRNYYETVSDLNGIATLESFEWEATSTLQSLRQAGEVPQELDLVVPEDAKEKARWFAKYAAIHASKRSGYSSRLHQMRTHVFDWLDDTLEETDTRLTEQFRDHSQLEFEKKISIKFGMIDENTGHAIHKSTIEGCIDIVEAADESNQPPTLWEVKFTGSLALENAIQVAIYGYLWHVKQGGSAANFPHLVLFNVRTGEKWNIITEPYMVQQLIHGLLKAKYSYKAPVTDSEFRKRCGDIQAALGVTPTFERA